MEQIRSVHLASLVESLWGLDGRLVQSQIDGIKQLPHVEYVAVNELGRIRWLAGERQSERVISAEFPLARDVFGDIQHIGTLEVVANLDEVYQELLSEALIVLVSNAFKTFLVAGFMLLLFRRVVIQHLEKIAQFADLSHTTGTTGPLRLDRPPKENEQYDELDHVVSGINRMTDELKSSLQSLSESEALLTQSASIANIGYAIWDAINERYITVSEGYAAIFGYTQEEFMASITEFEDDVELIHPDDRERYSYYYDALNLDLHDRVADIEYRIIRRDGEIRIVHERYKYVFESDGQATQALVSMQDITDRKLVEERLQKNQALYTQAELMGKLGYWEWDVANDWLVTCSEQYARIFGMTVSEALKTFTSTAAIRDVIHPEDRERHKHYNELSLTDKIDMSIEYRIINRSGEVRHVHALRKVSIDDDGVLTGIFGTLQDITERKELSEKLEYQASHDSVTGLINRAEFERRLSNVLDVSRQTDAEHALCYLDLDQFKVINDTCGHQAGDELLRQLGGVLLASARKHDTLARLGGDEFALLMEDCALEPARRVAEKIRRSIEEFRFIWEGHHFRIGVSIGLVPINADGESVDNALSRADAACYAAKDEGRNRVHIFHINDTDLARRQGEMRWVSRIDQALDDNRLQLCAQSIIPVDGGANQLGERMELLLRLVDEQGTVIAPGVFLPAAERYGLSTKLDRWVVDAAMAWLGRNPSVLERLNLCFINLSGTSLANEDFLSHVVHQMEGMQFPAEKICFEVTETAAIANLSRAIKFMGVLKGMGCKFALDDFGSGLSSFAYLKNLPVDFLKIDGGFIQDLVDDPINIALVRSINDVGKVMGKQTIAEFVENDETLELLREIGVDFAQGYGIARPAPIQDTGALGATAG